MGVDGLVFRYILTEAQRSEEEWEAGFKQGRVDLQLVGAALRESLQRAKQFTERRGDYTIRLEDAEPAFKEVIEQRFRCPFPFLLC